MENQTQSKLSTPIAIIFAGILIAGAVLFTKDGTSIVANNNPQVENDPNAQALEALDQVREVSSSDHIRGSLDADVFIIEYSDTECPFCKQLHSTLKQVMNDYIGGGKVAWVYRHFPLDQLHSKARAEAVALECAGEVGGNDKFWQYTDRLYEITPANNGLDLNELPKIAEYVGLDVTKFNECLSSGRYDAKIEADLQNAFATGGNGTPWSILVAKDGSKFPISGAQPYEAIKQLIESAL